MKHKKELLVILSFFIPLVLISFLYLVSPTKQVSQLEKRQLQQRPVFSPASLVNGKFSRELDSFFTDQLPFREFFIAGDQKISSGLRTAFGLNKVELIARPGGDLGEGENLGTEGKDLVTFPTTNQKPGQTTGPKESIPTTHGEGEPVLPTPSVMPAPDESSDQEPETSTETPTSEPEASIPPTGSEPSTAPTTLPTATPTAAPTTAPTAAPTAPPADIQMSGNILIMGDRAMEIFYSNQSVIDHYASVVNRVVAVSGGAQVYSLVAPTASQFYAPEGYRSGSSNQAAVIPAIYGKLGSGVKAVDAYAAIAPHTSEYLYFRTDHHWTGLGAYYAYTAFANRAGFSPLPLSSFTKGSIDGGFLGTLYAWANSPASLAKNPDTVEYWKPPVTATGYAYTDASMSAGYAINLIKTDLTSQNKYLAFTEGDHGLAKFETSVKNGRSIMVIKESYGNAMVPYLAAHYENVYVFDPRKAEMTMSSFVANQGIDDILVVNYSIAIGNAGWKSALEKSLR